MQCFGRKRNGKRCKNKQNGFFCIHHSKYPLPYFLRGFKAFICGFLLTILTILLFINNVIEIGVKAQGFVSGLIFKSLNFEHFEKFIDNKDLGKKSHQVLLTNKSNSIVLITDVELVLDRVVELYGYAQLGCAQLKENQYDINVVNPTPGQRIKINVAHSLLPGETDNFLFNMLWNESNIYLIEYHFEFKYGKKLLYSTNHYFDIGTCSGTLPFENLINDGCVENFDQQRKIYYCQSTILDTILNSHNFMLVKDELGDINNIPLDKTRDYYKLFKIWSIGGSYNLY